MKRIAVERMERFQNVPEMTAEYLNDAIGYALRKVDQNIDLFPNAFPRDHSENNIYPKTENSHWTSGFWPGLIWLAYDHTGKQEYLRVGEAYIDSFRERFDSGVVIDTHDLGFLYTLSCVAPYKLTGSRSAAELAVKAAYHLLGRYRGKGEFILAWGNINTPDNVRGNRMIIDCMMNLPLLYWASRYSGNPRFYEIARLHANTSANYLVRDDFSTHHTFFFDYATGEPAGGKQHQGYADDSCWARGQAWAAYGYALSYGYAYDPKYLELSIGAINYFLNHLPEDDLCYYDLCFMEGNEPRDSSANALICCAMLEVLRFLPVIDPLREVYRAASFRLMRSLTDRFTTKDIPDSNGILKLGTVGKPPMAVNECLIYGDYFYLEALIRMTKSWEPFW